MMDNTYIPLDNTCAQKIQQRPQSPLRFTEMDGFDGSSVFAAEDQDEINKFITSYQNTIVHNSVFDALKNYESEFKQPSSEFYAKWRSGHVVSDPKTSEWAALYRVIYGHD